MAESTVINADCMEVMRQYPDGYFDLAVVDPPYGINAGKMTMGSGKNKKFHKGKDWDSGIPSAEYFTELFRVSKNQVIWGGGITSQSFYHRPGTGLFGTRKMQGCRLLKAS